MKIAAYLEQGIQVGGGFQQGLNAALQMQRICKDLYDFAVYTPIKSNLKVLQDLGLPGTYYSRALSDKFFSFISWSGMFNRFQARLKLLCNFERTLIRDGVDLVYFLNQSNTALSLQLLNYIYTQFDVCHRDFPEFPEVRSFGEFNRREHLYQMALKKACSVITNCEELKNKIISYYSVDPDRILIIPLAPAIDCVLDQVENSEDTILRNYKLEPGYLFYPAQLWSHKGHVHLLEALALFRERNGHCPRCVFAGSEKGNLEVVSNFVNKLSLNDAISFLGFVPSNHVPVLYRSAAALVMPTYFGPTNLPPLEAMSLGVPIIYPRHLSDQCGDAAIYFDVDDAVSLCHAIEHVLSKLDRNHWRTICDNRLALMADALSRSDVALSKMLRKFERRLICWTKSK